MIRLIFCALALFGAFTYGDEIAFRSDPGPNGWIMKFNEQGIYFNRKRYPNATPDEFADKVIEILENAYSVEFKKKLE